MPERRGPGTTLDRSEIAWLVTRAGLTGEAAAIAVAVAWGESGGVTNIVRTSAENGGNGEDRGLWQFNAKAHPDITDAIAFNPSAAAAAMVRKSSNGTNWGPWNYGPNAYTGRPRTDLDLAAARRAVASPRDPSAKIAAAGIGRPGLIGSAPEVSPWDLISNPVDAIGEAAGAVLDPVSKIADVLTAPARLMAKVLGVILSPEFWRRAGLVALGAALVVGGGAILVRSTIRSTLAPAGAVGAAPAALEREDADDLADDAAEGA